MRQALTIAVVLALAPAAHAAGKYYLIVTGVEETPGQESGISDELKTLFLDELKKHPEFMLEKPAGMPSTSKPQELYDWLSAHKLKAFEVTLKVLQVTKDVKEPQSGKQYRRLVRGLKLSVFGDTVPEKKMAIGGDGEGEIAAEVGKNADLDKEGKALLVECAKVAVTQAVDMTVTKLKLNDQPAKLKRAKKK